MNYFNKPASKISDILGVEVNDFLEWFDDEFGFSFGRASSFEVYGKSEDLKDLKDLEAYASELN